jgi:hypothetical protein
MTADASRSQHLPDDANDVRLRDFNSGAEGGTAIETPIRLQRVGAPKIGLDSAVAQGACSAIVHVKMFDLTGDAAAFVQILTCVNADASGGQQVLAQVPLHLGQQVVGLSFENTPDTHNYIASRLVIVGEGTALVDYACWLVGARAR